MVNQNRRKAVNGSGLPSHNHPSGATNPSKADQKITKKLVNAGLLSEISVLDHLIVADDKYYSFADDNAL